MQDGLIETCIIHLCVLSVIAGLSSEQRGAKQNYNQSTRGLTLTTMGYVDWMSQDIHANREVLWAILYALRLCGAFFHTSAS